MNDVVSLTVMFLMIVALVASQAKATDYRTAVSEIAGAAAPAYHEASLPLTARAQAKFGTASATLSIDVTAEIRQLLLEGK
jgi:hypothetical protein